MTVNAQLATIFSRMATLLELLDANRFKVLAYQRGARVLEDRAEDVAQLVNPDDPKDLSRLTAIEGIGKGLAEKIVEFVADGKVSEHDELLAKIPTGLLELFDIPGLGPKTIALLWKQAGVDSLDKLKKKLEGEELAQLPGLGAKKIDNLRQNLAFAQASGGGGRVRIGQALPVAQRVVEALAKVRGVKEVAYAGSLRRGRETIGDIDLIVAASEAHAGGVSDAFVGLFPGATILGKGKTKTSLRHAEGLQLDLRIVPPESYGAALMYFTGSKEHNVALRERAIKRGLSLNEYALTKSDKPVAGRTEEEVYQALGVAWIPPELREDRGEIVLAEKNKLPKLVELSDIHAELHAHTTASDGHWSIIELAEAAAARGFHTVAVTDHSKSQVIAHGLDEKRLEKHIQAVRDAAAKLKGRIAILAGSEVDILADGRLDYPDALLKELDIVVASPHAALSQPPEKATARLLKAIENPYVTILGHATGRLVLKRQGLSPDMAALFKAAAARGVALEINANHYRLDLRDTHARAALEAGVKLAINTDAHGSADLDELRYGVLTARRAGATAGNVVNCLSRADLARWIKSTRD